VSYTELVYRPLLRSGYATKDSGSSRSVRNALRGATINKLIFSIFTMGGAAFPFFLYRLGLESISLRLAVSLSILLVFGYIVLYSIQVLPTFVSAGSFGPLAQLPLTPGETSKVATFTLWRTLDYILALSLLTQALTVAYFTGSAVATVVVFTAMASGSVLAVGAALWLTSLFQRRLEGGSLAGLRGLLRPVLFVLWGLGVMSAVFLFSLVSFVAPPLNALLTGSNTLTGAAASLVFPFSAGILAASVAGEAVGRLSLLLSVTGLIIALAGAAAAAYGASRIINGVVLPGRAGAAGEHAVDYSFAVRGPLPGYALKDVRVSSRNPATGFLFALPVFEILAVVVPLTATPVVRMSALLVGTQVGGGFALFIAFLLVTVEDLGIERRSALPLNEAVRTLSKVIISTATYLPVPLVLAVVLLVKPSTFGGGAIIPFAALTSVFAACVVEVLVLKALTERGKGAAFRFAAGVGSGECVLILPALLYSAEFLVSRSHTLSVEWLAACSAAELVAAALVLRRARAPRSSTSGKQGSGHPEALGL
jgi:predicted permease